MSCFILFWALSWLLVGILVNSDQQRLKLMLHSKVKWMKMTKTHNCQASAFMFNSCSWKYSQKCLNHKKRYRRSRDQKAVVRWASVWTYYHSLYMALTQVCDSNSVTCWEISPMSTTSVNTGTVPEKTCLILLSCYMGSGSRGDRERSL